MKKYITGCIYAINFQGVEEYEFKGVHPAMVVRMLKEDKMYYAIPLTTYTKERWVKCKRQGFGCRILSTNSIARVDKMLVVSEKQILKRYYNSGKVIYANPDEIEKVVLRVEEYLELANRKGLNEYRKYFEARDTFFNRMRKILLECSFEDIEGILFDLIGTQNVVVEKKLKITLRFSVDKKKMLTFKERYDKFKEQKGDGNM